MSDDLATTVIAALVAAGGNSRASRSARAKLQWRDRYGRWIEMGRGVKFKIRFPDGAPRSVIGKYVGAKDAENGQVWVSKDPNGLPDGFYTVNSNNAQEMIADLTDKQLAQRGISVGQDQAGNKVGERMSEDIPNASEIERADAPIGWKMLPETFGGKNVIETEDGDFRIHFGGKDGKWIVENRAAKGKGFAFSNPGEAFTDVEEQDEKNAALPTDADGVRVPTQKTAEELDAAIARQEDQVTKAYVSGNEARTQAAQSTLAELKAERAALDAPSEEELAADAPEGTPAAAAAPGTIDTASFGVEPEGFLVPTGKRTNDISPEGLALHIEAEMEHYTEGGKRLVVDTDTGIAEGYNSADTFDNAKAQAGGVGSDHVLDLASGKIEPVEAPDNVDASGTGDGSTSKKEAGDAEVRDPDAVEPQGPESGAAPADDNGVDRASEPAGDSSRDSGSDTKPAGDSSRDSGDASDDDGPSDPNRVAPGVFRKPDEVKSEREKLTQERDNNQRAFQQTGNRNVMDRLAEKISSIEARLAELDQEDSDRDSAEAAATPSNDAGSLEELTQRRNQLQATLEGSGDPKDIIALNEQIDALDNRMRAMRDTPIDDEAKGPRDDARPDWDDLTEADQEEERKLGERSAFEEARENPIAPEPREEPVDDGSDPWAPADAPASDPLADLETENMRNGLDKLDAGRPDDLTTAEVDALDVEGAGWAQVMGNNEDRTAKYSGLTPDQIAGDAPYVNGQPDFYQESPEAKAGFAKVMDFLEDPNRQGGMFDGLSDQEIEAFKEASAKDTAWVQAYNTWTLDDQPEWVGPRGETAAEAWATAMDAPTPTEARANLTSLLEGMDSYTRQVFERDRDRALDAQPQPDLPIDEPRPEPRPAYTPEELAAMDARAAEARERMAVARRERAAAEEARQPGNPIGKADPADIEPGDVVAIDGRILKVGSVNEIGDDEGVAWEITPDEDEYPNAESEIFAPGDTVYRYAPEDAEAPEPDEMPAPAPTPEDDFDTIYPDEESGPVNPEDLSSEELVPALEAAARLMARGDGDPSINDLIADLQYVLGDKAPNVDEMQDLLISGMSDSELAEARRKAGNMNVAGNNAAMISKLDNELDSRDPLRRLAAEQEAENAALPTEDELDNAERPLREIEAAELSDSILQARIADLEAIEQDTEGQLNPDEELELSVLREENLKRTRAYRLAENAEIDMLNDDLAAPDAEDPFDEPGTPEFNSARDFAEADAWDKIMEDNAFVPIDGRGYINKPAVQWAQEFHVGDVIKDADGNLFEVVAVTPEDIASIRDKNDRSIKEIPANDPAYSRVYDSELTYAQDILKSPEARKSRARRTVNPDKHAEQNPELPAEEAQRSVAKAEVQGKAMAEEVRFTLENVIDDPGTPFIELEDIREWLGNQPNAADTGSKPRRNAPAAAPIFAPDISAAQDDPTATDNFDIMWQSVMDAFPNARVTPEGDLVIDEIIDYRTPAKRNNQINKNYELRIRRTARNTAMVYVLETDTKTGERKALRFSKETHSFDTFKGRLDKAMEAFADPKLHIKVSRSMHTEHLGKDRNVGDNPLREFLERGVRPDGPDAVFNEIANTVIDRLLGGERFDKIVDHLRKLDEVDTDVVNRVAQGFIAQIMAPNAADFTPRDVHISYDGQKVEAGMRFEWTDHRRFLNWDKYDENGVSLKRANPDYQKVFRGTVLGLRDEHSDGKGRRYGDDLIIQFDANQPLAEGGFKNTHQNSLAAQSIRILEDDSAPIGEPFEAKREELRTPESVAAAFNVPVVKGKGAGDAMPSRTRVPVPRPKNLGRKKIDAATGLVYGYHNLRVPFDQLEAAEIVDKSGKTNKTFEELQSGDIYGVLLPDGTQQLRVVLETRGGRLISGVPERGAMDLTESQGGGFEYLVSTPEWGEDPEIPDHVEEGNSVLVNGEVYVVRTVGRGYAMVQNGSVDEQIRVAFGDIEADPKNDADLRAQRLDIIERMDEVEVPDLRRRLLNQVLFGPFSSAAKLDLMAKQLLKYEPKSRTRLGEFGTLLGAVGLPEGTINRLIEKLDVPGKYISDSITRTAVKRLPTKNHNEVSDLIQGDQFTHLGPISQKELKVGDRFVINDPSGNTGVAVALSDGGTMVRIESTSGPNGLGFGMIRQGRLYAGNPYDRTPVDTYRPTAEYKLDSMETTEESFTAKSRAIANSIREDYKDLLAAYKSGWSVEFVPSHGKIHDVGQIIQPKNGAGRMFMKKSNEDTVRDNHAEFLATVVARFIGITTIKGAIDEDTEMYVMNAVEGDMAFEAPGHDRAAKADLYNSYNAWQMGLLDILIGNPDRNPGNYMFGKDGTLYPIDHGNASFTPGYVTDFGQTFLQGLRNGSAPLTSAQLMRMRNEIAASLPFFEAMGRLAWYDAVMLSMDMVVETAREQEGRA